MATYGRSIEWHMSGALQRFSVEGHETPEAAFQDVLAWVIKHKWTPPRWWQFWRWNESYWNWDKEERKIARGAVRTT
jgi:hypothetical protein